MSYIKSERNPNFEFTALAVFERSHNNLIIPHAHHKNLHIMNTNHKQEITYDVDFEMLTDDWNVILKQVLRWTSWRIMHT